MNLLLGLVAVVLTVASDKMSRGRKRTGVLLLALALTLTALGMTIAALVGAVQAMLA